MTVLVACRRCDTRLGTADGLANVGPITAPHLAHCDHATPIDITITETENT